MKNFKLIGVFLLGLCFFVGAQAQEAAVAGKDKDKSKSMVKKSSLSLDDIAAEYPHFPKIEMRDGEDAKAASARHRKALQEWQQKYPKEYAAFEKKMKESVKLTDEGKKAAAAKKEAAEKSLKESKE